MRRFALVLFVTTAVLIVAATRGKSLEAVSPEEKPNIIYIMADDLGYGDLSCYGQQEVQTPHIDQLAAEGMKFTSHYSGHTVCRPSRLVLMTGLHSGHTPISSNAGYTLKENGLTTVTELMQQAGYVTGGVGKWALGRPKTTGMPHKQHFDFWFGYLNQSAAHNYYPEKLWLNDVPILLPGNEEGEQKYVSVKRQTYSHDMVTHEALDFIQRHRHEPFFLQAHYTIPHANNQRGRATGNGMEVPDYGMYANRDWPDTEKGFAAMVTRLDRDVGRILDLLRRLDLAEKTLILFTSDNGPHHEGGHDHEFFDSNGPLQGYKRDLYEGGIRVPMIAWWPGTVKAGSVSDHPSAFWDFLPTACELAGIEPPADIDGISFFPELLGKKQQKHDYLYWQFRGKVAVRMDRWKGVRPGQEKPLELYNLDDDLAEETDIAEQHPEIVGEIRQIIEQVGESHP